MMIIQFENENPYNELKLFYGDKERWSTMTSVVFITPQLLVCASYCARKLYLVKFDLEQDTYEILDGIDTVGDSEGKESGSTDLIDYAQLGDRTKRIVTSNFTQSSISIYHIVENDTKLKYIKSIVNEQCGPCHGISFHYSNKDIVFFGTSGTKNPYPAAYAIDISKKNPKPFFAVYEKGWLAKDICFMNKNNMFVLYCNSAPNPNEIRRYATKIVHYYIDIDSGENGKICDIQIDEHHADCCLYTGGHLYVTVESADADTNGKVLIYNVDQRTGALVYKTSIQGFHFPHGIDLNYGMLAVTEYGNNDIVIIKEEEIQ